MASPRAGNAPCAVRVRVPATTSNLGPGFDVLGLALGLYNEIELERVAEEAARGGAAPVQVEISGEGAGSLPRDASNLVVRTALGATPKGFRGALRFKLTNRIPLARGLGSSAAARLGGLLAARALFPRRGQGGESSMLEACRLEGHPDNVVAAFHGGLCAALQEEAGLRAARLELRRDLAAAVCSPDFELSTDKARAVLPERVGRRDAVATSARVAFLVHALARGRCADLRFAMADVIHQPYRRKLIPGLDRVIAAALRAGAWGAALSGAGPSVFAFVPRSGRGAAVGRAMRRTWRELHIESRAFLLEVDRRGATVDTVA